MQVLLQAVAGSRYLDLPAFGSGDHSAVAVLVK